MDNNKSEINEEASNIDSPCQGGGSEADGGGVVVKTYVASTVLQPKTTLPQSKIGYSLDRENNTLQPENQKSNGELPLSRSCNEVTGVVEGLSQFHRFNYNTKLNDRAKTMSREMTKSEQMLWFNILKSRKLAGYKFVKQKQVFNYIVDFYCSELLLVIEVDGSSHDERVEYDKQRDDFLRSCGLEIMRIGNSDVEKNLEGVYTMLMKVVNDRKAFLSKITPQV
jgi:very-short-patch-repair endonuclease